MGTFELPVKSCLVDTLILLRAASGGTMVLFAIKTLLGDKGKMLTAVVGVMFSLVLVNVQGGLFFGLMSKASLLVENCQADIWVGHFGLENVDFAEDIPETWVNRIRGIDGVERAEPYIVGKSLMTLPRGDYEDIWVIGSERDSMLGTAWSFSQGSVHDLAKPNAVTVERIERWKLGEPEIGDLVEIAGKRARIVAFTDNIVPFLTLPYVFTTLDSARTFCQKREGYCSYFLIKARPGIAIEPLIKEIEGVLGVDLNGRPNAEVYTKDELAAKSGDYWVWRTGIGISFGAATVLGLFVGLVMVAQSLYALVLDHVVEYATLKAMGASNDVVYQVIMVQAIVIALIGIAVGCGIVYLLKNYLHYLSEHSRVLEYAPILIPRWLVITAIVLVMGICLLACILPFNRLRRVDPATVLQG